MLNKTNENIPVTYHFGHKPLFDGYLTTSEFLCDGYVIERHSNNRNVLVASNFLCDGYAIDKAILCDGHLIKEKL